ncbi:MAG: Zinc carboxypeptidase, partial [Candidatus Krumholzibacteriota bacterium]|nr:Zinc carboxypeptidase [Candidatus Krumholzibacteriota bacterium]
SAGAQASGRSGGDWDTFYEKSGKTATSRYSDAIEYCRRLDAASPWIQYASFGKSEQGRDLPLLIASKNDVFTPAAAERARANGDVVLLIQAGIHSGEIEGKDAGLMLFRDIAVTKKCPELLDHVTILFIPILNVDGHERFGPYNRINQNGPEEMGWRTTANGLNLNRDYLKADSDEIRAWLRLFNEWLPDFFIDSHTTDGADYQYVMTYIVDIFGNMAPTLTDWARDVYVAGVKQTMAAAGFPLCPYVYLVKWPDPKSGIVTWVSTPRFAQGYTSIQNRPGVLVESHMLKAYSVRVAGTYQMFKQTVELLGRERKGLRLAIAAADAWTASPEFRRQPFPLRFALDKADSLMIDFAGVAYVTEKSDLTGGSWYRFSGTPETFKIPYFSKQRVTETAQLPEAYIVPPEWKSVIDRLAFHGIALRRLEGAATLEVQSYRFENAKWQEAPYEGRHPAKFDVTPITETRTFPAGSVVIDMAQHRSQVAAHILEPMGPDSYVQWGFFDAIFEQKEYTDAYVMEKKAREMLAKDGTLKKEFEEKKASDPEFAKSPERIINWFYQHSPYWDDRKDVYPVGKIVDRAAVDGLRTRR